MHGFEGYVGVKLWEEQQINDLFFSLLFGLLIVFAFVYHKYHRLFGKMVRDIIHVKERSSIFEEVSGNETVFKSFMVFQSLFLFSLISFISIHKLGYMDYYPDVVHNLATIGLIFIIILTFYMFKHIMYVITGSIFATNEQYKNWRTGYMATTGMLGVFLYIPVLWLSLVGIYEKTAIIIFASLFILWRLVIIYKSIRIFNIKSIGILYIFLYLCGQEILPLLFLYEGIKYLYNFIDELALWY